MINFKKTALAVLALSSATAFAGTMGPVCAPGNVTVPCERSAWDFAGQALYVQESLGSLNFPGATISTTDLTGRFPNAFNKWGWGFFLEGSYHFSTGNDVDLNWYHVDNKRSTTITGPFTFLGTQLTTASSVFHGSISPSWDLANLELAQHVDFSPLSSVRFHGGISYTRVFAKANASITGTTTGLSATSATYKTDYNGFGPRVGADAFYGFGNGLQAYASSAMALYAGTLGASASTASASVVTSIASSAMRVIPSLQAKLGGTYTYSMAQGDLSLDVGWLWINYFQAISTPGSAVFGVSSPTATTTANIFASGPTQSDFGLQGVYFGLKWLGNVV